MTAAVAGRARPCVGTTSQYAGPSGTLGPFTDDEKEELTAPMERFLPGAGLAFLVGLSADPVARELGLGT